MIDYVKSEELRSKVRIFVNRHFDKFFTEYAIPEEIVEWAVDDVMWTSGISEDGCFSDGDISLACQRAIMSKMGLDI